MRKLLRRSLRAGVLIALVAAASVVTAPAHAQVDRYPPIYDPLREVREEVKERVNETRESVEDMVPPVSVPSDPVGDVQDAIAAGVTGSCVFQGATIEGAAVAGGVPDTTGIVCRVYDQWGVQRGGCALFMTGAATACAAPTEAVLGPPTVCWEAYAMYSWGTVRDGGC